MFNPWEMGRYFFRIHAVFGKETLQTKCNRSRYYFLILALLFVSTSQPVTKYCTVHIHVRKNTLCFNFMLYLLSHLRQNYKPFCNIVNSTYVHPQTSRCRLDMGVPEKLSVSTAFYIESYII